MATKLGRNPFDKTKRKQGLNKSKKPKHEKCCCCEDDDACCTPLLYRLAIGFFAGTYVLTEGLLAAVRGVVLRR